MYVYVAGPLTKGHRIYNVRQAIDAAERIALRGHTPFVPYLHDFWKLMYQHDYEFWMQMDFDWINKCDILVRLPGESLGSDREVEHAKFLHKPVFIGLDAFMNDPLWTKV